MLLSNNGPVGLYVPKLGKFFYIKETTIGKIINNKIGIDRLRKILLAKGLLDFSVETIKGNNPSDLKGTNPIIMNLADAKKANYTIEEIYASEAEAKRAQQEKSNQEITNGTGTLFKKST